MALIGCISLFCIFTLKTPMNWKKKCCLHMIKKFNCKRCYVLFKEISRYYFKVGKGRVIAHIRNESNSATYKQIENEMHGSKRKIWLNWEKRILLKWIENVIFGYKGSYAIYCSITMYKDCKRIFQIRVKICHICQIL